jgi:hypothetical protein
MRCRHHHRQFAKASIATHPHFWEYLQVSNSPQSSFLSHGFGHETQPKWI